MKTILFFMFCGIVFCHPWKTQPAATPSAATTSPEASADAIDFKTQIQPILQDKCSPCHFPGGKMYEALPFDQAKTILDHPEGVLKRINKGEEGRLLKAFLGKEDVSQ